MNETINILSNRRSCRSFKPTRVPQETIDLIIKAALHAPSGMNKQPQIIVSVRDQDMIKKLSKMNASIMGVDTDPFYNAPDLLIVLSNKASRTYVYDGSLTVGNILNASYSLGVDCTWIHRAKEVFESEEGRKLLKQWNISCDYEGIAFCILGFHDKEKEVTEIKENRVYYV